MNFKKAVLSYATDKGITQTEFAEKAGLNRSQFSKYVAGITIMGSNVLQKIYDAHPEFESYLYPEKKLTEADKLWKEIDLLKKELKETLQENNRLVKEQGELLAQLLKLSKKL